MKFHDTQLTCVSFDTKRAIAGRVKRLLDLAFVGEQALAHNGIAFMKNDSFSNVFT
jgi:hypothetical protein